MLPHQRSTLRPRQESRRVISLPLCIGVTETGPAYGAAELSSDDGCLTRWSSGWTLDLVKRPSRRRGRCRVGVEIGDQQRSLHRIEVPGPGTPRSRPVEPGVRSLSRGDVLPPRVDADQAAITPNLDPPPTPPFSGMQPRPFERLHLLQSSSEDLDVEEPDVPGRIRSPRLRRAGDTSSQQVVERPVEHLPHVLAWRHHADHFRRSR